MNLLEYVLIILLYQILLSIGSSLHLIENSCVHVPHFIQIKVCDYI